MMSLSNPNQRCVEFVALSSWFVALSICNRYHLIYLLCRLVHSFDLFEFCAYSCLDDCCIDLPRSSIDFALNLALACLVFDAVPASFELMIR